MDFGNFSQAKDLSTFEFRVEHNHFLAIIFEGLRIIMNFKNQIMETLKI